MTATSELHKLMTCNENETFFHNWSHPDSLGFPSTNTHDGGPNDDDSNWDQDHNQDNPCGFCNEQQLN